MKEYFVWLTALTAAYEKDLLSQLLNRGYIVSSAAESGKVNIDNYNSAALFGLKVARLNTDHQQIHSEILNILQSINGYYYSLIVCEVVSEAVWMSTNITFAEPIPTTVSVKKKELN